jgi:ribosome-associated protein
MSRDYVIQNITKILEENKEDSSKALALSCAWTIAHFKGENLKVYESRLLNPLADYFVIGSVENKIQANSIASEVRRIAKEKNINVKSIEGTDEAEWVLIDLGDVVIHVFLNHTRDLYDLDNLWSHYPKIQIPNEFYHSQEPSSLSEEKSNVENYF